MSCGRSWLDSGPLGVDRGFDRYPLLRGHVTAAATGSASRRCSARSRGYDGGATDLHLGPLAFGLAYCDHVVVYRFAPRSIRQTDCEITWLVNDTAVEGRDYDKGRPDLALGCHDDRGQEDHRAQPGRRRFAVLTCRGRSRRWKISHSASCCWYVAHMREALGTD
jgi:Rieske 2Fe-2S family protein